MDSPRTDSTDSKDDRFDEKSFNFNKIKIYIDYFNQRCNKFIESERSE